MPAPKKPPQHLDADQSKRFIEAARELGADETGEEFMRAFAKIVPPKKSGKIKSSDEG